MKSAPTDIIQTNLQTYSKANAEADIIRTELAEAEAQLASLSETGNLADEKVLATISKLQTKIQLLPKRIATRETAAASTKADLEAACHQFIETHLGPHLRDLVARARAKVMAGLKVHFASGFQNRAIDMDAIVEQSDLVVRINRLMSDSTIIKVTDGRRVEYAERLLANWTEAEIISAEISTK